VITRANPTNGLATVVDELGQCADTTSKVVTLLINPTPTYVRVLSDIVIGHNPNQFSCGRFHAGY